MNRIVVTEIIPRLGNGRPENGTRTDTLQSVHQRNFTPLFSKEGRASRVQLLMATL
jgi:hypothetical protein